MGRIKIKDLPKDVEISKEEMKKMRGGILVSIPNIQNLCVTCWSSAHGTFKGGGGNCSLCVACQG